MTFILVLSYTMFNLYAFHYTVFNTQSIVTK